jgi:hypothetical protein
MPYILQHYIPQLFCRLTKEYKLYSSVIELCSSVITEERVLVFCSDGPSQQQNLQLQIFSKTQAGNDKDPHER